MTQKLFFRSLFLFCMLLGGKAIAQPTFINGLLQSMPPICENSAAVDISSLLYVNDPDVGNTLTWTAFVSPASGVLSGFPATGTSTGSTATIGPGLTYTPNAGFSGTDLFVIAVSDGINAPSYTTINVVVNPFPVVGAISGPTTVCIGGTMTLMDTTAGGNWGATNGNATVDISGNVTGVSAGTDVIEYSVTNSCGVTTVTYNVTASSTPFVEPIGAAFTDACSGTFETLTDVTPGGLWTASNGNATVDISTGDLEFVTPGGTDVISYTVTLSCGVATATITVTVDAPPVVGPIVGITNLCVGVDHLFTDPGYPGGFWVTQNGDASVGALTGLVHPISPGVDTIAYQISNACGPTNAAYTVTINPLPDSGSISGLNTVCVGSTITLTDPASAGTVAWSASNTHAGVASGVVVGVSAGLDIISYSVTNICGTATAIYPITVNPLSVAGSISGPISVCVDAQIPLANTTSAPVGVWTISNANASINSSGMVTGVVAGFDTVIYTVGNVCDTVNTKYTVSVNPLPYAGPISGPKFVCAGTRDTIVLTDSIHTGVWTTPNVSLVSVSPGAHSDSGLVTGLSQGVATVWYIYNNVCGADTASYLDTVKLLPDSAFIAGPTNVCAGATITLNDTASAGVWSSVRSSTATIGATTGIVTGVTAGTDTLKYTVTNVCGSTTAKYEVTVKTNTPSPGTISGDTAVCPDIFDYLTDPVPGGTWTVSDSAALLDASGVLAGIVPDTSVTITYKVNNGCGTSTTTFSVRIKSLAECDPAGVQVVNAPQSEVNIFPNPAMDELTIQIESGSYSSFVISNELGQTVISKPINGKQTSVNINSLAPGLYNITLTGATGTVARKLIKE